MLQHKKLQHKKAMHRGNQKWDENNHKKEGGITEKSSLKLHESKTRKEMVPGAGLEPARGCPREILSLLRLPISPSGHNIALLFQKALLKKTLL